MAAKARLCQIYILTAMFSMYDLSVDLNIIIQLEGWRQYILLKPFHHLQGCTNASLLLIISNKERYAVLVFYYT
jgi:hypothetical protein